MKILLFLFIISCFASAQSRVEDLNILVGKWKLENGKNILYEEWKKINDTTFAGISYVMNNDVKNVSEKLSLLKLHDHIVYIAQPGLIYQMMF
jgi:hypothetical protein